LLGDVTVRLRITLVTGVVAMRTNGPSAVLIQSGKNPLEAAPFSPDHMAGGWLAARARRPDPQNKQTPALCDNRQSTAAALLQLCSQPQPRLAPTARSLDAGVMVFERGIRPPCCWLARLLAPCLLSSLFSRSLLSRLAPACRCLTLLSRVLLRQHVDARSR
jgi:hypothetical protein